MRDNVPEPFNRACAGCVLPKRKVGPHLIIIAGVLRQNAPKVLFVEHDHMVDAFASRRPDQAFNMTILPGRPKGRRPVADAHRPNAGLERGAERSVIVPNEILWRPVRANAKKVKLADVTKL